MYRAVPICFDCRHQDLRLEKGRAYHWCSLKRRRLADNQVTRKACRNFEAWPPLEEVPWP